MINTYILNASRRQIKGKNLPKLRAQGRIPAVLYGHNTDNNLIEVKENDFRSVFTKAGQSALVDFYRVDMKKKLTTTVPLRFVNEAPAVKELAGALNCALESVTIECLPADLIQGINVDISGLKTFND